MPAPHDKSPNIENDSDKTSVQESAVPVSSSPSDAAGGVSTVPVAPEAATADEVPAEPAPATEAILIANGYEYVTEDTAKHRALADAEDDSLTFSLMRNAEVVEKPTREERKADRAEAKAAAAAAKIAEQERAERLQAARLEIAAAAAAKAAQEAAERDRLAPVLPTQSATSDLESTGMGSKPLFIGSAVLTAAAALVTAVLILPNLGGDNDSEISMTTAEISDAPTAEATKPEPQPSTTEPAPIPSFNTKVPTVTEHTPAVVEEVPVAPGTVEYVNPVPVAPVVEAPAPVIEAPAPVETAPVETAPVETAPVETAEPSPSPVETLAPTGEATAPVGSPLEVPTQPAINPSLPAIPTPPAQEAPAAPVQTQPMPAPSEGLGDSGEAGSSAEASSTAEASEPAGS